MAKLNKNRIKLGDIVFVNMQFVSIYDDFVGKVKGTHEGIKVVVRRANGEVQRVYINRCNHANEAQRKEYFIGVLRG